MPRCIQATEELAGECSVTSIRKLHQSFVLEMDASGAGFGAVLSQEQKNGLIAPIAFTSCTLQKHKLNYTVAKLEAFGVCGNQTLLATPVRTHMQCIQRP